ncbi:hypothetical protein BH20ACI4_BH20ACI4_11150 [soil metagenome]
MKNNQKGFSLIELILVVLMIGIIASIAIPSLTKAVAAAENGSTLATMKTIQLVQSTIFSQKSRYGNLDEINQIQNGSLGQVAGNQLTRGKFLYEMLPADPTSDELKVGYVIKASRTSFSANEPPYVVQMDQTGITTPIFP